jgi:2-dehydro-3-deoxy-L-rhamnonate dehydrogenase (NAD+)
VSETGAAEQTFVVVGAASGIGRAAAELLGQRGARVACLDMDEAGVAETASSVAAAGGQALSGRIDVTQPDTIGPAFQAVTERWGQLHGLVNCAGITGMTNLRSHEVPLDDFDRVVRVNLYGSFLLSQAVLPLMLPYGYGRVLHVASIAGKEGNAGMVSYSASKAGIIGMVKSQGKEYATTGITVNALAPAVIQTPLVDRMPPEQVEYMTSRIPMQRCGTLTEVAELISWILSPAASYITGFTFDLSGGRATY